MRSVVWKVGEGRHDRQGVGGAAYFNDSSSLIEMREKCARIVIPVVVGWSPISHPAEFQAARVVGNGTV